MKIACLLTPLSDHNLSLASQIGVEEIVATFPGTDLGVLFDLRKRVEHFGLRLTTIERFIPHHKIVHGLPGADEQIAVIQQLIRNMGEAGLTTLCYNWMPSEDWNRTSVTTRERGGALVTEFNAADKSYVPHGSDARSEKHTSRDELWNNLKTFQEAVVPVAEAAGINLAIHPDDPPLDELNGQPQIMSTPEAVKEAARLVPSERNGICFCQGTFASRGDIDIPKAIGELGDLIKFIHFRDVMGEKEHFRETFHDNGKTDMAACWRAYEKAGLKDIPIRPDHVPSMTGDSNEFPGYEMQGRLFAVGFMKGLAAGYSPEN
ncbi:MAG: mannonate dehydratase [Verrucomicrobiales bacterium]|nr:mannonate dehydratase [Verrucomicrobiales bacterium]